jgi:glutathione S-transferase
MLRGEARMILIGQFDSPFVRRVGVTLHLYEVAFEHRPWSVWRDEQAIAQYNPLRRVPTLVLDDGTTLVDSFSILDWLDEHASEAERLAPRSGPGRLRCLRTAAIATGVADKVVSLFYETMLHGQPSPKWVDRCTRQIEDGFDVLDHDRRSRETVWWFGDRMSHADIAVACTIRFTREALPGRLDFARWPQLVAHSERCESQSVFQTVSQPFTVST